MLAVKQAGGTLKTKFEGINSVLASVLVSNITKLAYQSARGLYHDSYRQMKASLIRSTYWSAPTN